MILEYRLLEARGSTEFSGSTALLSTLAIRIFFCSPMIGECDWGVHDLSRVEVDPGGALQHAHGTGRRDEGTLRQPDHGGDQLRLHDCPRRQAPR